jgi:hypothetical protein
MFELSAPFSDTLACHWVINVRLYSLALNVGRKNEKSSAHKDGIALRNYSQEYVSIFLSIARQNVHWIASGWLTVAPSVACCPYFKCSTLYQITKCVIENLPATIPALQLFIRCMFSALLCRQHVSIDLGHLQALFIIKIKIYIDLQCVECKTEIDYCTYVELRSQLINTLNTILHFCFFW